MRRNAPSGGVNGGGGDGGTVNHGRTLAREAALDNQPPSTQNVHAMNIHASCAARDGMGVLLTGPAGSGKSDLLLRLLSRGFLLVADDRVDIIGLCARAPAALAGLLEIRGLGIVRIPHVAEAQLVLAVDLTAQVVRMPIPARHSTLDLPLIRLDPAQASAPDKIVMALDCALGRTPQIAGAFAA